MRSTAFLPTRTTEIDFEDLVEQQDENEMPKHVIWLEIESKHLNGIARFWTMVSIVIQCTVYALIILMCFYISLVEFKQTDSESGSSIKESKLTPLLFKDSDNTYYYNMIFSKERRCTDKIAECSGVLD